MNFAKICALLPVGLLLLIPQRLFPAPGPAGIYSNLLRAAGSCPVVRYSSCNLQIQQGGEYIKFNLPPRSTCCRYRIMQGGGCISRIVSRSPCNVGLWAALLILSPGGKPSRVTLRRFFVVPSARCGVSPGLWGIGPAGVYPLPVIGRRVGKPSARTSVSRPAVLLPVPRAPPDRLQFSAGFR